MLGQLINGQLQLREMHRFVNGFTQKEGHDCWNIDHILEEILVGLQKVKKAGFEHITLGIDTWAVDYVLVGRQGQRLKDPVSYRDARTKNAIQELTSDLSKEYIYQKTGIQFLDFNTLYQLFEEDKDLLANTDKILMIPDYLGYVLTDQAVTEVTNASTTQMLSLREGLFDENLLQKVNVNATQFPKLVDPGTVLGELQTAKFPDYDLPQAKVITVATHDTASAVVGTPGLGQHWAYLSSGTWSLIGAELNIPENGTLAFQNNYTNEWGAYGTYRFLKNIMGLWIIQNIQKELHEKYSFAQLAQLAQQERPFQQYIDVNDSRFQNPANMIQEVQAYCRQTKQVVPQTPGEIAMAAYSNLSLYYANELQKLDEILGSSIDTLNIVGGGANVSLMNQLTANIAGVNVEAGPTEATAIGNLIVQMISQGEILNVYLARSIIVNSFDLKHYQPQQDMSQHLTQWQTKVHKG
ncbi:rhamnulokinase [Bombilactobacillus folatiphilus]|uniref:Rhamnulokinase n=1 Tax=Bombilactobacillus folatiphilus TaxID=2923362 RepID=A0ABY4PAZ5_9LACO|nr:rhamnulokinase [Bombilactobacillus folatiphilus]UQS82933.1 rhamnulokinase [Bombilactobacillus folatiphilus]